MGNHEGVLGFRSDVFLFPGRTPTANETTRIVGAPVLDFGDNVNVWWQPNEFFRATLGRYVDHTIRGRFGDTLWGNQNWLSGGNNNIFHTFSGGHGAPAGVYQSNVGALLRFTFGDLSAYVNIRGVPLFSASSGVDVTVDFATGLQQFGHVFERTQFAVAYNIPGIGLIRAQYIGENRAVTDPTAANPLGGIVAPRIGAAFHLTMVDNLGVDVGFTFPFSFTDSDIKAWDATKLEWATGTGDTEYQAPMQLSLGANYALGDIGIWARVDSWFGASRGTTEIGPRVHVHLVPSFNLGFMTVGVDGAFEWLGANTVGGTEVDGGVRWGIGAWAGRDIGRGRVQAGINYRAATEVHGVTNNAIFSVPVWFSMTL
jgi:hypothetical protein